MVRNVNVALDDRDAEELEAIKEDLGLTWAEALAEGLRCLAGQEDPTNAPTTPAAARGDTATPPPMPDGVDTDALRDALPGSGPDLDARQTAVLTMYDYLRTHGEGEKGELLDAVDVDATGYASADSFWANAVKASGGKPNALELLPGVTLEGDTYRYTEP